MNYYNPYFYTIPTGVAPKVGLFSRLFGGSGVTLGGILNGTQRALNFANQAIPLVKQVRPMLGNAKTMFKVMNEFKRAEKPNANNIVNNENLNNNPTNGINNNLNNSKNNSEFNEITDGPTFFM